MQSNTLAQDEKVILFTGVVKTIKIPVVFKTYRVYA